MPHALPTLCACLLLALPCIAQAQRVQRCTGADGRTVYTDRACSDVGATLRSPAPPGRQPRPWSGEACPRRLSRLVAEIGAAIHGGDVNRLAGVYDWRGVRGAAAARVLDRLEALVQRPLVDIRPVYPGAEAWPSGPAPGTGLPPPPATSQAPPAAADASTWMPSWSLQGGTAAPGPVDRTASGAAMGPAAPPPGPPGPAPRQRPVALRLEQVLAGTATPVRTEFALLRSGGCFWVRF